MAKSGLSLVIDQQWLETWPGSGPLCCWTMLGRFDHFEPLTDAWMLHRSSTLVEQMPSKRPMVSAPVQLHLDCLEVFRCLRSQCDDHGKMPKFSAGPLQHLLSLGGLGRRP